MRFICLGYVDEKMWDTLSESEGTALMEECFAYDDVLRAGGHFIGGEALQSSPTAKTLRRDQRAVGRDAHPGGQGSERGRRAHVKASRRSLLTLRDSSRG